MSTFIIVAGIIIFFMVITHIVACSLSYFGRWRPDGDEAIKKAMFEAEMEEQVDRAIKRRENE